MARTNKKAVQAELRKKHREQLKAAHKKTPDLERAAPKLLEKPTILIVCEGENTEPSYFRQFRLSTATVKAVGEGYNTLSLVNRADVLAFGKNYDQIWCVFDKDDFSAADFNGAITRAEQLGFGVAYSNQSFEYWIILHLDDHQGAGMNRAGYDDKINTLLKPFGANYDGKTSKIITEQMFDVLSGTDTQGNKSRIDLAIQRAKRNYDQLPHQNPASEESSTTVFRLVEELLKYV